MERLPIEKLRLDKSGAKELAASHMKWLRFLILAEAGVALLNTVVLLAGAALYGKETLNILRKRMENQT